jgi:hypothetical protein
MLRKLTPLLFDGEVNIAHHHDTTNDHITHNEKQLNYDILTGPYLRTNRSYSVKHY